MTRPVNSPLNSITSDTAKALAIATTVSDHEMEARLLVTLHNRDPRWETDFGAWRAEAGLMKAMGVMWSSSVPAWRLNTLAAALSGEPTLSDDELRKALARLVRCGYLRSRMVNLGSLGRTRCYELNY